ncbi:DNA adenine methylase [Xenorhabdus innexi]|uniref:Site-specific DNA-methyltransferase (adenine-specific) n=1 Tax=Xenorhabdus innexi TaxID=290109 RepID=A0A1N6MRS6_9GAMM|nr:Dam family site-specific DNA-(adenine-N6)-methyltransferase [Xenorhabdus innexi]PHM38565.1 DNA adenine methylase [Xenorhabdus innexi]SIP71563.1 Retron EC67 DNA adenine methylase [Xenorhabdus innexi]
MANKTILKWAGSKVRIMDQLLPHLPAGKRLVEPFAGSCAVMMNTDYPAYLVADVNADLIDLYQTVKTHCDRFTQSAINWFSYCNERSDFYELRDAFNSGYEHGQFNDYLCRPALFLFLNRHCFNGLCRYNTKGEFNVAFGHYKKPYFPASEIWAFADKSQKAAIRHADWQDTLIQVEHGDVIYCDPPYLTQGKGFTRYHEVNFTPADHELLAVALKLISDENGVPVTVSNSIEAKELYADLGFTIHEIDAHRSIAANGSRKKAREIIAVLN